MAIKKTIVEWVYEPSSYFEGSGIFSEKDYDIKLENGLASAILSIPQDPVPGELLQEINERLEFIFMTRQLYAHNPFKLKGFSISQIQPDGSKSVNVNLSDGVSVNSFTSQADIIVTDKDGNVVYDSKATRIDKQFAQVESFLKNIKNDVLIKSLLESYSRAVSDPSDELVHLYEIREALSKELGGKDKAVRLLGISKKKWDRLGMLANMEPLEQGRHRGKHKIRRAASQQEIQEARDIARELIESYIRLN